MQIAVHNEYEIIELLARGETDRAQRLRLIHLTVAAEHPHLPVTRVCQTTGVQVLQEPGLVDRHERPKAHRNRWKLPKLRHQLRVRVTRQSDAVYLLPEVIELCIT